MGRFHVADLAEPHTAQLCGDCSKTRMRLKPGCLCLFNGKRLLI